MVQLLTSNIASGINYAVELCRDEATRVHVHLDEHGRCRLGGLGRRGEHGLRGRHRVRRRRRQQLLSRHLRASDACHRVSRALPPRDCRVRRHGRSPAVLLAAVRHDAGQLGSGEQDGHGDVGVHAEHQLGGARVRRHRRHGRLGNLLGHAADCRRGGACTCSSTGGRCSIRRGIRSGGCRWRRCDTRCSRLPTGTPTAAAPRSSATASCRRPRHWRSARRSPLRCTRRRPTAPCSRCSASSRVSAPRRLRPWTPCWSSRPRSSRTAGAGPISRTRSSWRCRIRICRPTRFPVDQVRRFLEAVLDHPDASAALKKRATEARSMFTPSRRRGAARRTRAGKAQIAKALPRGRADAHARSSRRARRSARSAATASIRASPPRSKRRRSARSRSRCRGKSWSRGPIGEYLEVIDVDPASGCFYEPVDLDDPNVLAQSGLAPSEGTPQFHQQMVYAVASLTIRNFERALGRRCLWRPGPPPPGAHPKNDSVFVSRLRVYPHALREANAYYSPQRIALLFGYFKAIGDDPGDHVPGGMVFTCLSHDIIAHETTHALLDGMHRNFLKPTNPDVRAFHEALRRHRRVAAALHVPGHPAARDRQHARRPAKPGEPAGTACRPVRTIHADCAARCATPSATIDPATNTWRPHQPDPAEYDSTTQPHARGAILVAAVFEAFLNIYTRRSADLVRLASGGTGVLRPGALHPDLVARLADEAAKVGPARADDVHPCARLLPARRHHVRRVPARGDHRRHRCRAGR